MPAITTRTIRNGLHVDFPNGAGAIIRRGHRDYLVEVYGCDDRWLADRRARSIPALRALVAKLETSATTGEPDWRP